MTKSSLLLVLLCLLNSNLIKALKPIDLFKDKKSWEEFKNRKIKLVFKNMGNFYNINAKTFSLNIKMFDNYFETGKDPFGTVKLLMSTPVKLTWHPLLYMKGPEELVELKLQDNIFYQATQEIEVQGSAIVHYVSEDYYKTEYSPKVTIPLTLKPGKDEYTITLKPSPSKWGDATSTPEVSIK
jgi:hypothetical protein